MRRSGSMRAIAECGPPTSGNALDSHVNTLRNLRNEMEATSEDRMIQLGENGRETRTSEKHKTKCSVNSFSKVQYFLSRTFGTNGR
jgi:2,4-dienoyl-CoA reductase-like NADH-dependent reductase (Old Yellow Enzyme family)